MAHRTLLYLASSNTGKFREYRQAAAAQGVEIQILPGLDQVPPCEEDGLTFEENARKKALYYSRFTNQWVFADDSGLAVEALHGAPGVFSARYAGLNATDAENNAKLLRELALHPKADRSAQYICWIALALNRQIVGTFQGQVSGLIQGQPKGSNGFGYDPYFFYPPLGKTFAELTADEKFEVSHRGVAFRKLLNFLTTSGSVIPSG